MLPSHHNVSNSRFIFDAGATTATITLTPVNDDVIEGPETVVLTLINDPSYAIGSPGSATATIISDDTPSSFRLRRRGAKK